MSETMERVQEPRWASGDSVFVLHLWVKAEVLARRCNLRFERTGARGGASITVINLADGAEALLVHEPRHGIEIYMDSLCDREAMKTALFARLLLTPDDLEWDGPESDARS